MSSERILFTPTITAFTYQNFSGGESPLEIPAGQSIFERPGAEFGGPRIEPAGIPEAELKRQVAAAHAEGFAAGRGEALAESQQKIADARLPIAENLAGFGQERDHYFRAMETEVVDLALSIARKILHREAQVDRVVLGGVVRVALEKISGATNIRLCVHPSNADAWKQYVSQQPQMPNTPEIVEDASLRPDQLVLRTSHGSTSMGVDSQFAEIEKGFTDLMNQRQRGIQ